MATFTKFNSFVEAVAEKLHDLGSDQLVVALSNTAPVATNTQLSNLTQIAYTNLSTRNVVTSTSAQTAGTYKLTCADLTLTATGAVAGFRYVTLYNDTSANDLLIGFWDYGQTVVMANAETFVVDFNQTDGVLTIA